MCYFIDRTFGLARSVKTYQWREEIPAVFCNIRRNNLREVYMKTVNFAILAPGNIARTMAAAAASVPEAVPYAVASRDLARAKEFADKWGYKKAYGSYEEMVKDPEVELVYVSSPHSHHYQHAKLCLEHGKNVLVEKPFTINAAQARELIKLSKEKGLLLAEAMWTRYMPSRFMVQKIIDDGTIGEVSSLTANLGYELSGKERLINPKLGGGALLDLGVYPINFALMFIKGEVKKMDTSAVMSPAGIDLVNSITLTFENDKMAILHSNMLARTNRRGVIYGSKGYIEVENINNIEEIAVYDVNGGLVHKTGVSEQVNGFEYELLSCIKAIENGSVQCEEMPHSEILRVMEIMDENRRRWGMKLPCE